MTLEEHWDYVRDSTRTKQFEAAINKLVAPGSRVLDLGCGVGIWGSLCLRAGAAAVVAIDRTNVVEIARETLARAGHGDKLQAIKGVSQRVTLSELVDLIVCDHVGYFGIDYGILDLLTDARRRFLKPDGRIIPASLNLELALVESSECRAQVDGWGGKDVPEELHWLRQFGVNAKYAATLSADDLVSTPVTLGRIDFLTETRTFFSWQAELIVQRAGETIEKSSPVASGQGFGIISSVTAEPFVAASA